MTGRVFESPKPAKEAFTSSPTTTEPTPSAAVPGDDDFYVPHTWRRVLALEHDDHGHAIHSDDDGFHSDDGV